MPTLQDQRLIMTGPSQDIILERLQEAQARFTEVVPMAKWLAVSAMLAPC